MLDRHEAFDMGCVYSNMPTSVHSLAILEGLYHAVLLECVDHFLHYTEVQHKGLGEKLLLNHRPEQEQKQEILSLYFKDTRP